MPVCRDCKFYNPVDDAVGDCFGVEVPGDTDVDIGLWFDRI
ncbi:MAG: hypothetical protein U9Q68_04860 [Euryarchaeota archaeon]|nr:hypothetical protein [Euryarchaeota archaeon]